MSDAEPGGLRLPPFPNDLMYPSRLDDVVTFVRELPVPARYRRSMLQRWASVTGAEVDATHYRRVAGGPPGFEG